MLGNCTSETYNVKDNHRIVIGNPRSWEKTIYIFGTCIVRGYAAEDKHTIPSLLQGILHDNGIKDIRIVNFGGGGGLDNYSDIRDFMNILSTDMKKNDIVIHIGYNVWDVHDRFIKYLQFEKKYELSQLFNKDHEYRCFIDIPVHLTPYANTVVAEYIWEQLKHDVI